MRLNTFIDLLIYKTRANVRAEVSRLYLNYAWWVLEPLFSMSIYYVVFGIFMNSPTPHFAVFLLIGITQWQWFASTVNNSRKCIYNAGRTMMQISIPKVFFPLEVFLQTIFKHFFVLSILFIFLLFYPLPLTIEWIALVPVLLVQALFVVTCATFVAAIVPFLPDLSNIIGTCINIMFFVSGIFFDVSRFVLPEHRHIMYINPMAGLIREYRRIIIDGQWPDWIYLLNVLLGTLAFLAITALILKKYDRVYPRICQE